MGEPFDYWVNNYQDFVEMGGSTREQADLLHREMWGDEPRLDCRLLRYVSGKRLKDITPKAVRNYSEESRKRKSEKMLEYWRKRKATETVP